MVVLLGFALNQQSQFRTLSPKILCMSEWLTTEEACAISGYHIVHLRRLIRGKRIAAEKKGGSWWVSVQSLQIYLEGIKQSPDRRSGAKSAKSNVDKLKVKR